MSRSQAIDDPNHIKALLYCTIKHINRTVDQIGINSSKIYRISMSTTKIIKEKGETGREEKEHRSISKDQLTIAYFRSDPYHEQNANKKWNRSSKERSGCKEGKDLTFEALLEEDLRRYDWKKENWSRKDKEERGRSRHSLRVALHWKQMGSEGTWSKGGYL